MNIYKNVKEIADRKGLSLREVERIAGVGHGAIARWKTQDPRISGLIKVSKALKVNIYMLLR